VEDNIFIRSDETCGLICIGNQTFSTGFGFVRASSTAGGHDLAIFYKNAGNESFLDRNSTAYHHRGGVDCWTMSFDRGRVHAKAGQTSSVDMTAVDYISDSIRDWIWRAATELLL